MERSNAKYWIFLWIADGFFATSSGMITVYAPGRAELLGNHTDYNEGYVLSIAVDRGTTVVGRESHKGGVHLRALDLKRELGIPLSEVAPQKEETWANYVLGVVSQFWKRGLPPKGFEMEISSTLPMGAGLSSSAALEMATGLFLQKLYQTSFSNLEIAKIGQASEHEYVGVKCGLLDQISSLFSKAGCITFIDCRTFEVETFPMPAGARFVIANSHAQHALVTGEYNERRVSCETAAGHLNVKALRDVTMSQLEAATMPELPKKRARHVVGENERVQAGLLALKSGDLKLFGALMLQSHESSQKHFENSCPELDLLVAAAKKVKGCYGSRLSGGGFGGATINLVEEKSVDRFIASLQKAHPQVECLVTTAADGARLVQ